MISSRLFCILYYSVLLSLSDNLYGIVRLEMMKIEYCITVILSIQGGGNMSELKEIREKILVNIKDVVGQNKEKVEDAYKRVMKLEYIARREGLLALEYEAEFIPKEIPLCNEIIEMIEMIVDGMEPQIFEELMTIRFFAVCNYTEVEALLYFLYARSMLMIQSGVSSWLIEELFNAVIPNDVLSFRQKRIMMDVDKTQKISEWKSVLTETENELLYDMSVQLKGLSEEEWKIVVSSKGFYGFDKILPYLETETKALAKNYMNDYRYYVIMRNPTVVIEQELIELKKELEKIISRLRSKEESKSILDNILKCSDKEIQLILRNVDNFTLSVALKDVKEEVAECFFRNMSLRLKYMVQEDMEYMGPICMSDVEDAQRKIVQTARNILDWREDV